MVLALVLACALFPAASRGEQRSLPALEPAVYAGATRCAFDDMITALARADVVFLGEEHDDTAGHGIELLILRSLAASRPRIAVGLEMLERDIQLPLDEYLAGLISETALLQAVRPWPNYRADYHAMVEFCREHRFPVIATNAPRRYVNMVSRGGPGALDALSREAKRYLAPLPISAPMPEAYAAHLDTVFAAAHGGAAATGTPSPPNMKAAQALWDATMAESVARFRRSHRATLVLHVNGAVHSDRGWGIVARLRDRAPRERIAVVSIKPDAAYPNLPPGRSDGVADYVIITPPGNAPDPRP